METEQKLTPAAESSAVSENSTEVALAEDRLTALENAHREALSQVRLEGEVRYILARKGAKNPDLAAKTVDLSKVQVTQDGIFGVEEAVERLIRSDPYLFGTEMPAHAFSGKLVVGESSTGAVHGSVSRDPESMSDAEYYRTVCKI